MHTNLNNDINLAEFPSSVSFKKDISARKKESHSHSTHIYQKGNVIVEFIGGKELSI